VLGPVLMIALAPPAKFLKKMVLRIVRVPLFNVWIVARAKSPRGPAECPPRNPWIAVVVLSSTSLIGLSMKRFAYQGERLEFIQALANLNPSASLVRVAAFG
jgi:hypothetical protein